jgi:hypothetical protein
MTNLYKLIALCCCMAFASAAVAQSDYKPGFVVLSSGDTLQGQVSYRTDMTGSSIGYKASEQAKTATYTARDIAGYGFPGDRNYRTRILDHADTLPAEPVFMQELVRGTLSLYVYKTTYFVEKRDNPDKLHKLYITKETYINSNKAVAQRDVNHHVRTLNTLMQDCFEMFQRVERVKLAEKSLVDLVTAYNSCAGDTQEQTTFKESQKWFAIRPGVVAGMSHTSLHFSARDERYLHLDYADFNSNTHPTFGVSLLLYSPRINKNASLLIEGRYAKNSFQADPSYVWFEAYYDNEISFDLDAFKLTTAFRYDFSGKTLQPFLNVGVFHNFMQRRDYTHVQYYRQTESSTPTLRDRNIEGFVSNMQQGVSIGAGSYFNINKRRLSLEARYELGMDVHEQPAISRMNELLKSKTTSATVLLGFHF